ncbi:MAG TPA: hypothetical protein VNX65_02385 [Patescibacteria group bacterium]|jgi:hypothetical protein|nr:hypothetical protein [Patescibacteria group bacterium]
MAFSIVQSVSATATSAGSITKTISSTGSGNLLLIAAVCSNSTQVISVSVAAGTAQTFVNMANDINNGGTGQLDAWYVKNCASGTTSITASRASGAGQWTLVITEVSGANATSPLDQTAFSTSTGTTGTTATTTQTVEFWWAVFMCCSSGAGGLPSVTAISSPWTSDQAANSSLAGGNTDTAIATAYQTVSATGTANATATDNNAAGNGTAGFTATFKGAAAGATTTSPQLMMMGMGN